jgi:hypothetical protein
MKLSQLIAEIGDENVTLQVLRQCLIGSQKQRKGHVEITFGATGISLIDLVAEKPEKEAFVIWLPAAKLNEIRERVNHANEKLRQDTAE